jgi:hypothetical protein
MKNVAREGSALALSYLGLRRAVGFVALALPPVLLFGHYFLSRLDSLPTMSDSYYTEVSGIFVGSLCVIGAFLLSYHGYERGDRIASFVSGAGAIGVALVPCGGHFMTAGGPALWGWGQNYHFGWLHFTFAAAHFAALAYFCLFLFTRSGGGKTRKKAHRNCVYYACGIAIVACLALVAVDKMFVHALPDGGIFAAEAAMVLAFGLSWIVKGEAIGFLNDSSESQA